MVIFALPILIIYLMIRLGGGGKTIYKQERIGYKGKPFTLYKFRSMRTNAEMDGQPMLFLDNDPRLTRIGRFLRAHHLDEFPQLWNILKGEMSFAGARPALWNRGRPDCTAQSERLEFRKAWADRSCTDSCGGPFFSSG